MKTAEKIAISFSNNEDGFTCLSIDDATQAINEYADQYKTLLAKYIEHVKSCEGVDFINNGDLHSDVEFTQSELDTLKSLAGKPTF